MIAEDCVKYVNKEICCNLSVQYHAAKFLVNSEHWSAFQILRLCLRYTLEKDVMMFSNGLELTRNELQAGGFGSLTDTIFNFAASLKRMDVDESEFSILSAICLVSGGELLAWGVRLWRFLGCLKWRHGLSLFYSTNPRIFQFCFSPIHDYFL